MIIHRVRVLKNVAYHRMWHSAGNYVTVLSLADDIEIHLVARHARVPADLLGVDWYHLFSVQY